MGSWNTTCHLSNLPVREGEKVVVLPVTKTGYYDDYFTYDPNSVYNPLTPLIKGAVYNDYGTFECEDDPLVMDFLNRTTFTKDKEPIKFESVAEFLSSVMEGSVKWVGCEVELCVYLEDIYNGLIINNPKYEQRILDYLKGDGECPSYYYSKKVIYMFDHLDSSSFETFAKAVGELESFAIILDCLRRGFQCITGRGSQTHKYELHFKLNELIRNHITSIISKDVSDSEWLAQRYGLKDDCKITPSMIIEYADKHVYDW